MDQPDHDLVGDLAAMTAFVHYRMPGATDLAEWVVAPSAAMLEPLARADLGWLSRQAQGLVDELRGPGGRLRLPVLRRPVPARAGRGRVLPRRDRLPDPLVPQPRPLAGAGLVLHRHADRARSSARRSPGWLMAHRRGDNPPILGLVGWQWVYIVWGIPAVVLGFVVLPS